MRRWKKEDIIKYTVFSVPRASESWVGLSHLSQFRSLHNLKSSRLMMHQQWPNRKQALCCYKPADCPRVNIPCKSPSFYFYTPRLGLCLSGADSCHKHHNSTSCDTVRRGLSTSHFLALNGLCLHGDTIYGVYLWLFDKVPAHFIIFYPRRGSAEHVHYCHPSSTSHSNPTYIYMHSHGKHKHQTL